MSCGHVGIIGVIVIWGLGICLGLGQIVEAIQGEDNCATLFQPAAIQICFNDSASCIYNVRDDAQVDISEDRIEVTIKGKSFGLIRETE